MSSDDWVNVDFSDPESVARFEEFAEKRRDILLEVSATSYERGTAYSNLIILAGYAGAFSVLALVKGDDILSPRATAAVGTFLGLSLLVFVTFEIWKMIELSNRGIRVGTILCRKQSAEAFLRELAEFRRSEQEQDPHRFRIVVDGQCVGRNHLRRTGDHNIVLFDARADDGLAPPLAIAAKPTTLSTRGLLAFPANRPRGRESTSRLGPRRS